MSDDLKNAAKASSKDLSKKEVETIASKATKTGHIRRRDRPKLDLTPQYTEYWTQAQIDEGIALNKVAIGRLHLLANSRKHVAFVRTSNGDSRDIFIEGLEARNRALDGDLVAIEYGPDKVSTSPIQSVSTPRLELAVPDLDKEAQDHLWAPVVPSSSTQTSLKSNDTTPSPSVAPKQRTGRVVAVLASNTGAVMTAEREFKSNHVGKLQAACARNLLQQGSRLPASETFAYFVPSDTRVPRMRVLRGDLPYEFTQDPLVHGEQFLYLGKISSWPANQDEPIGKLAGRIGQAGEIGPETEALLMENGVDHGEFPDEALACLRAFLPPREEGFQKPDELWWKIPPEELASRRDLRDTLIYTIDPYTAKDIDDALHCIPLPDGTFEMGVHIADVSYFVKAGSALDAEAHRRSTSVYLVQKVIPMLPALLSEELCSLNPNVDRLAFSCIWRMKPSGELCPTHPPWFGRTIIRSACKLHYGLAQSIIDNGPGVEGWDEPGRIPESNRWTKEQVHASLRNMHLIGMNRRRLRFDPNRGGALEMQTAKMSFELDSETGNPIGVRKYPMHDTNRLVEEFMLLANFLVAQRLIQSDRQNAFLRHHPPPDPKEMQKMVDILQRSSGVTLFENGKISPSGIHEALKQLRGEGQVRMTEDSQNDSAEDKKESSLMIVASELLKKPMNNALYFIASDLEDHNWRHWALNIKYYTHFTSPIRRYADVCVHRQLAMALMDGPLRPKLTEEQRIYLRYAAQQCNEKKDASRQAQEASDALYLNLLVRDRFKKKDPLSVRAVVMDLGPRSFTAFIPEFGVSKRVHVQDDLGWRILSVETADGVQQTSNEKRDPQEEGGSDHVVADDDESLDEEPTARSSRKRRSAGNNKSKSNKKDDEDKPVIGLRVAVPKQKVMVDLKVLSELALVLVPKQHQDKRGGLDYKLVPKHNAAIPGSVALPPELERSDFKHDKATRHQPQGERGAAHHHPHGAKVGETGVRPHHVHVPRHRIQPKIDALETKEGHHVVVHHPLRSAGNKAKEHANGATDDNGEHARAQSGAKRRDHFRGRSAVHQKTTNAATAAVVVGMETGANGQAKGGRHQSRAVTSAEKLEVEEQVQQASVSMSGKARSRSQRHNKAAKGGAKLTTTTTTTTSNGMEVERNGDSTGADVQSTQRLRKGRRGGGGDKE